MYFHVHVLHVNYVRGVHGYWVRSCETFVTKDIEIERIVSRGLNDGKMGDGR